MKYIKEFLVIIWRMWIIFLGSLYILIFGVFVVLPLSNFKKNLPIIYPFIYWWAKIILYGGGFSINYQKLVPINKNRKYIFIANHSSVMDIMLMITILGKNHPIAFVGKAELLKIPVLGKIFKRFCIPVDRTNRLSRANVYKEAKKKIEQNLNVFIFPEGGVTNEKEFEIYLDAFKDGAFNIAIETETPLAVFSIHGLNKMLPFSWVRGYPGKIHVRLLNIFETKQLTVQKDKDTLKKQSFDLILNDLRQFEH